MGSMKDLIARNVRTLRDRLNLTQEELAEKAGLSLRAVQKIEHGVSMPRSDTLDSIANVLQVTSSEMLSKPVGMDFVSDLKLSKFGLKIDHLSFSDSAVLLGKFASASRATQAAVVALLWKDTSLVPQDLEAISRGLQAFHKAK
jgi:transcriptional regulator with XRE-family HTH domain